MRSYGLGRARRIVGLPAAITMAMLGTAAASPGSGGESEWNLTAGTEYGRDGSRASLMSADYAGKHDSGTAENASQPGHAAFGLSGLHSDTPATSASDLSTASGATVTTSGQIYFRYGIEALRGGVAFDSTRDENYRNSHQWTGTLHSGANGWGIDVNVSTRQTRFDGFPVNAFPVSSAEASRLGQTITTGGDANCTLRDTGYGGVLTYSGDSWTAYGSGSANSYGATACSFSIAVPNVLQRLTPSDFQSLSGVFLNRAQVRAGGQIGQQTQLLQLQFGVGVSHSWGRAALAFDYLHAKSEFANTIEDGYALSGAIPVLKAVAIKLAVGTTVTNSVSAPYGGVYVLVNL
jgi:hypothetical protein